MLPESDYQILKLTHQFYEDYPEEKYPEILRKQARSYTCLLFQTHDYFICIPYRTEMPHRNGYRFKQSSRSKEHRSGLDYSKIAIIKNTDYLEANDAIVDKDEYQETVMNIEKIKRESLSYVEDYVAYIAGTKKLDAREYQRRYGYTALQHFHTELGI